jgi:hypothetical protein
MDDLQQQKNQIDEQPKKTKEKVGINDAEAKELLVDQVAEKVRNEEETTENR